MYFFRQGWWAGSCIFLKGCGQDTEWRAGRDRRPRMCFCFWFPAPAVIVHSNGPTIIIISFIFGPLRRRGAGRSRESRPLLALCDERTGTAPRTAATRRRRRQGRGLLRRRSEAARACPSRRCAALRPISLPRPAAARKPAAAARIPHPPPCGQAVGARPLIRSSRDSDNPATDTRRVRYEPAGRSAITQTTILPPSAAGRPAHRFARRLRG